MPSAGFALTCATERHGPAPLQGGVARALSQANRLYLLRRRTRDAIVTLLDGFGDPAVSSHRRSDALSPDRCASRSRSVTASSANRTGDPATGRSSPFIRQCHRARGPYGVLRARRGSRFPAPIDRRPAHKPERRAPSGGGRVHHGSHARSAAARASELSSTAMAASRMVSRPFASSSALIQTGRSGGKPTPS
jgi:hypothetical protein